jgi:hypothetical protein
VSIETNSTLYPHTSEAFNTADGTSTICLYRHINITFIPTGYIDVSIQTNSTSPISCIKRLRGVGIKVILMCLYKQIVLVPSAVLNASEVMGLVLFLCTDTSI